MANYRGGLPVSSSVAVVLQNKGKFTKRVKDRQ